MWAAESDASYLWTENPCLPSSFLLDGVNLEIEERLALASVTGDPKRSNRVMESRLAFRIMRTLPCFIRGDSDNNLSGSG